MIATTLAALLFGSSLGKVLTFLLLKLTGVRLFSEYFMGMSNDLAFFKTYDIVDFYLTLFLTLVIFTMNYLLRRKKKETNTIVIKYIDSYYLIASILIFLQSHFVESSGKILLLLFIIIQALYYLFLLKVKINQSRKINATVWANGLLLGLALMLFTSLITTSFALPYLVLITTILIYALFASGGFDFIYNPLHLILVISIFYSSQKTFLVAIVAISITAVLLTRSFFQKRKLLTSTVTKCLYPAVIIFLIFFNPLFYIGNLDTIEEGFWLSWLQRLINGQVIYRDFFAYHPPLIIWLMYAFIKLTQVNIFYFRLFLHLLQVLGLIIYYFAIDRLLARRLNKFVVLLIIAALTTSSLVRNNIEIRMGLGLLPIIAFYKAQKNFRFYLLSGLFSAITVFSSIDVGLAAVVAIITGVILFDRKPMAIVKYTFGFVLGSVPVFIYLLFTKSLSSFIDQIVFYAKAFSQGYFNLPLDRYFQTSFFRWHLFYEYLSDDAWFWELSRLAIVASIIYILIKIAKRIKGKKLNLSIFVPRDKYFFVLAIFGFLLFRSALGRSDYYHLIFVLTLALMLFYYIIEKSVNYRTNLLITTIFLTLFFTNQVNAKFLSQLFYKFSTYGRVIEDYQILNIDRSKILVDINGNKDKWEQIVAYIQTNVGKNESFFAFPWSPELYFLTDRNNASSFDTPYSSFSNDYQEKMIEELKNNLPKIIVYDTGANFGNLSAKSLNMVNDFILNNYRQVAEIYSYKIYR